MRRKTLRKRGLIIVLLALIGVVSFSPVTHNGFINMDDNDYITDNPRVAAGLTGAGLRWSVTAMEFGNWHPLTWISHMLDTQLFGLRAGRHHLVNVLLHGAVAALLFLFLEMLTGALWPSAFVAALFAVHPLHVESVAWASERKDLLAALFWMLVLGAYRHFLRRRTRARYLLIMLLFAAGLMSKPMLVTLPCALLLLDFWPLGRITAGANASGPRAAGSAAQTLWRLAAEKTPLFALALVSAAITLIAQRRALAVSPLDLLPLGVRLANVSQAYLWYLAKTVWPSGLSPIYPYPGEALRLWASVGSAAILAILTVLAARSIARRPYAAVGWFWFLGTLVPVIGLVQVGYQFAADRYSYLPLVGLFIAIAWGIRNLAADRRVARLGAAGAAATVLAVFAGLTYHQAGYWRDSITLFERSVAVVPENWLAYTNLGLAYNEAGRFPEAETALRQVIRIKPGWADGYNNLGLTLAERGRFPEAIQAFGQALHLKPSLASTYYNLGLVYTKLHRIPETIDAYRQALRLNPSFRAAYFNLGLALAGRGDRRAAEECCLALRKIDPPLADRLRQFLSVFPKP